MKIANIIAATVLAFIGATPSIAQTDHLGNDARPTAQTAASAKLSLVEGEVKKVNKATGKVTLKHGPLPDGMPAMTMAYGVKDPAWLDKMKVGQTIRFAIGQRGGDSILVQFEPAK
ncbi:MAG: copper-binding protein [Burkholderiales bacterium]|nr:copper-binding protein [Burkholderiales bacterium]